MSEGKMPKRPDFNKIVFVCIECSGRMRVEGHKGRSAYLKCEKCGRNVKKTLTEPEVRAI